MFIGNLFTFNLTYFLKLLWWSRKYVPVIFPLSISATKWVVYTIYRWLILPIYLIHEKINVDTQRFKPHSTHVRNSDARPAAMNR